MRSRCCRYRRAIIPHFETLVGRLKQVFGPLGVNLSIPSLRVNEQLRTIAELIGNRRRSSLTLAPEVARDDMRERIGKRIRNDDLYEGCRLAFRNRFQSVKLYFMCGLPGSARKIWTASSRWRKPSRRSASRSEAATRR